MKKRFNKIFEDVLDIEKGYVNNPNDPGGETKYGITKKVAKNYGYKGDMKDLPLPLAKEIAYEVFFKSQNYHKINNIRIANEVFEQAYNMGSHQANLHLQEGYNFVSNKHDIAVDSIIGPNTLKAVNNCTQQRRLFNMLNALQVVYYFDIDQPEFIDGWINKRVIIRPIGE